jgi:hypothetical protein
MRRTLIDENAPLTLSAIAERVSTVDKALHACRLAWQHAHDEAIAKGQPPQKALRLAQVAYKLAMPKMDSHRTIRAAIACIAQGIQLEVFDGRDGSQLLYAAQVALSLLKQKEGKK